MMTRGVDRCGKDPSLMRRQHRSRQSDPTHSSAARVTRVAHIRAPGPPSPISLSQLTDPRLRAERRMFIPPPGMNAGAAERAQQQSRGYVLGIILLVLFLSSQDFSPPARRHRVEAAKGIHEGVSKHREDVKEKVSAEPGPNPNDKNGKSRAPIHAPRLTTRTPPRVHLPYR